MPQLDRLEDNVDGFVAAQVLAFGYVQHLYDSVLLVLYKFLSRISKRKVN